MQTSNQDCNRRRIPDQTNPIHVKKLAVVNGSFQRITLTILADCSHYTDTSVQVIAVWTARTVSVSLTTAIQTAGITSERQWQELVLQPHQMQEFLGDLFCIAKALFAVSRGIRNYAAAAAATTTTTTTTSPPATQSCFFPPITFYSHIFTKQLHYSSILEFYAEVINKIIKLIVHTCTSKA